MVFRSFVLGLLGACAILLAQAANRPVAQVSAAAPRQHATIIDVAPNVSDVVALVGLHAGERVIAVGDVPVATDLAAGAAIRDAQRGSGTYLDLTTTERRVLVLLH